jgi:glycosyltransferase involved in cell wall biosynthesis
MRWSAPGDWDKIKVIRCGLDAAYLQAEAAAAPEGSTEFVCVARLAPQKGLPLLIDACARLRDEGHEFSLLIIGDGELRPLLEDQVERLRLGPVVKFAGVCTGAEIQEHLIRARTFVLPSFAEGLPVVLMEALAVHRPVITTAIAGIPELVDESCGWLVPAGSVTALGDAMRRVLQSSPAELFAKGAKGAQLVHRMHNADENAALLVDAVFDT